MLVFLTFALAPFLHAVWLSFFKWDGITIGTWYGFGNYRDIFHDPLIREAFGHAVVLVVFFSTIPVGDRAGHRRDPHHGQGARVDGVPGRDLRSAGRVLGRGRRDLELDLRHGRTVQPGPACRRTGRVRAPWLGDFTWALSAIGLIGAWMLMGLCMVLFVAGIQQIPSSLYDAVRVDGGGRIRELITVTIPGLRYEFGVVLTLTIVGALKTFDLVFVLTRGGPGTETTVPGLLLYNRAFLDGRVGQACAIAVVLAVLVFVVTVVLDRVASREA